MRVSAFVSVVAVLACVGAQQQNAVPAAIQKLRAPLTNISLKELYDNMNNANTVEFYTNCVLGDGSCNHVGAALRHLLVDLRPNQEICYGCTSCQRERVQYVLDVLRTKYTLQACKIQNALKRPVFDGGNPCV